MSNNNGGTPKTFQGDLSQLPLSALGPLTNEPRWVIWRWEKRIDASGTTKWTKPPFQPLYPQTYARVDDPATWGRYFDAVAAVTNGQADGIGFMLLSAGIAAIDIDHVRDVVTGEIVREEVKELIVLAKLMKAYMEITPSGTGLRIIMKSNGHEVHRRFTIDATTNQAIEFYRNCPRYITVTGIEGEPPEPELIEQPPELGDQLLAKYEAAAASATTSPPPSPAPAPKAPGIDLNQAGPQRTIEEYYDDLIRNGVPVGQRSEIFSKVVWYLASLGWSPDQISEELEKYPNGIAAKYIKRLDKAVNASYAKWGKAQARAGIPPTAPAQQAPGAGAAPTPPPRPVIEIREGEEERILDEIEAAVLPLRVLYQRGNQVVRVKGLYMTPWQTPTNDKIWQIIDIDSPFLKSLFAAVARLERYDGRRRRNVLTSFPEYIARMYLSPARNWKLPILSGIVHAPHLRKDGSLCETPGYDPLSGLLFVGQSFPPVPTAPSWDDAANALGDVEDILREFPFVSLADQAVAVSLILTELDRRAMRSAPLHAFTAPVAGTGKSKLVNLASILATGRSEAGIAQGRDDVETEKKINAALLAGVGSLLIDNCDRPLQFAALAQLLTEQAITVRPLGVSRVVRVPTTVTVSATGNNLTLGEDMNRRTLLCRLDAGVERPELRKFNREIEVFVHKHRGELVTKALTVLRAWHVAGMPKQVDPLGGFEDWSRRVREPLIWLGRQDPCSTMEAVRERDPMLEAHRSVLIQWQNILGTTARFTVAEVIARAEIVAPFISALLVVASDRSGTKANPITLSRWLKRNENKIVDGLSLIKVGITHGVVTWALKKH
jgi:hypothetical protein